MHQDMTHWRFVPCLRCTSAVAADLGPPRRSDGRYTFTADTCLKAGSTLSPLRSTGTISGGNSKSPEYPCHLIARLSLFCCSVLFQVTTVLEVQRAGSPATAASWCQSLTESQARIVAGT